MPELGEAQPDSRDSARLASIAYVSPPWTGRLRYVILAWYGLGALWSISLPVWIIHPFAETLYGIIIFVPGPTPIPAAEVQRYTDIAANWVWGWTIATLALDLLVIAGTLMKKGWAYLLAAVVLTPWALISPSGLTYLPEWNASEPGAWALLGFTVFTAVAAVLWVWMLVAEFSYVRKRRQATQAATRGATPAA